MTAAALELVGVSKTYRIGGRPSVALQRIDLQVDAGELVWLRGPSGSGKSTVIRVAALLTAPDEGEVRYDGRPVRLGRDADLIRRDSLGVVFQHDNLLPELSLVDNLSIASRASTNSHDVRDALAQFDLAEVADSAAKQVSGGQSQRAAICRALLKTPSVLLADEPTSGLDGPNGELVRERLQAAARAGCAVLISSHDDRTAEVADRVVTLEAGAHV